MLPCGTVDGSPGRLQPAVVELNPSCRILFDLLTLQIYYLYVSTYTVHASCAPVLTCILGRRFQVGAYCHWPTHRPANLLNSWGHETMPCRPSMPENSVLTATPYGCHHYEDKGPSSWRKNRSWSSESQARASNFWTATSYKAIVSVIYWLNSSPRA